MELTDEQKQHLQSTILTNGENAWDWVQTKPEDDRPWLVQGILSLKKGLLIDPLSVWWEARDIRYPKGNTDTASKEEEADTLPLRLWEIPKERKDIQAYEIGLPSISLMEGTMTIRQAIRQESRRLVSVAKKNGNLIEPKDWSSYGKNCLRISGESIVYLDERNNRVVKFKNPFAYIALKGEKPYTVLYEHYIHNHFFGDVPYQFVAVSQEFWDGDLRFVYEQPFIATTQRPSKSEIQRWFGLRGFRLTDDGYWFTDGYVSFTDVWADNCLKGTDGTLYFIDPIIKFETTPEKAIEHYI